LRLKLLEIDEQVKEQYQKINAVKVSIAKNDDRIESLLRLTLKSSSKSSSHSRGSPR